MVPNGWTHLTLGDLTTESAFGPRFSSDLYSEDGSVGTIRTTDLDEEGNIDYSTIPYANLDDSFSNHYLEGGDLLITRSGTCGIPCIFERQEKPIVAGAFLIRFRLVNNVESKYLHALLKSKPLQKAIQSLASGGVQKNLSGTSLKKLEMVMPPLPEQKKIAQILSTWDQAIATTERLLDLARQQKKALMQQLLTGKKRFPGFEGEWLKITLGKLTQIYDGTHFTPNYVETGIPFYSVEHVTANKFDKTKFISHEVFAQENKRVKLERNDILMTRIGDIGTVKFLNWDVNASFYVSLALIKNHNRFNSGYLSFFLQSAYFQRELWQRTIHVAFPKKINLGEISNCSVLLPSHDEQIKIAKILSAAIREVETLQSQLDGLQQEKKALMQTLLTGQRRVRVEA